MDKDTRELLENASRALQGLSGWAIGPLEERISNLDALIRTHLLCGPDPCSVRPDKCGPCWLCKWFEHEWDESEKFSSVGGCHANPDELSLCSYSHWCSKWEILSDNQRRGRLGSPIPHSWQEEIAQLEVLAKYDSQYNTADEDNVNDRTALLDGLKKAKAFLIKAS